MTDTRSDDDVLDLTEEEQIDDESQEGDDEAEKQAEDEGEEELVFRDEPVQAEPETELIKHLRHENRRLAKEAASARRQPQAEEPIEVGPRPTMEDPSIDYDEDKFYAAVDAWDQRRAAKSEQDRRSAQVQEEQQRNWQKVQDGYVAAKKALRFADKQEAEDAAFADLTDVQQAVIAKVAANPALVIYAAGKSPAKLAALSAITDPLVLAREIGKMEATMTTRKRARPPEPDTPVRGDTVAMGDSNKALAKLEAEADRTGDRSKVIAYKRAQKEKAK